MFYWNKYPFVRYTFILLIGIIAGLFTKEYYISNQYWLIILFCFITTYVGIYFFIRTLLRKYIKYILSSTAFILLLYLGVMLVRLKNNTLHKQSLKQIHSYKFYLGQVIASPEQKKESYSIQLEILSICQEKKWIKKTGKVLITIRKKNKAMLRYGDQILVRGVPVSAPSPLNPYEFNYKEYLATQDIAFIHSIDDENYKFLKHTNSNRIKNYAFTARDFCDSILKKHIRSEDEYEVAAALVLGVKGNLNSEIKKAYTNTGVIHVLAVSGLHIAIIFEVLMLIFGSLVKVKHGKLIVYSLVAVVLWFFGLISGFSPSVLRAVMMFSFILLAKILDRDSEILNTLAASAFFLLLVNPYYAFDAGFQLSYIAVAGIIYLHPKLYAFIFFKNWYFDKIWTMISVTLAAQIATLPIILYYFHQVPVWFLPANLVMIPGTTILLYLGILLILLSWINQIAFLLGEIMRILLKLLHLILAKIEDLPISLISDIDLSFLECILLIGVIISIFYFFSKPSIRNFICVTIFIAGISISILAKRYEQSRQKIFIVYAVKNKMVFGFVKGRKILLLHDSIIHPSAIRKRLNNHFVKLGIEEILYENLNEHSKSFLVSRSIKSCKLIQWEQNTFILNGSLPFTEIMKDQPDLFIPLKKRVCILLKNGELKKLILNLNEKQLNENILQKIKGLNLYYHNIAQEGAYIQYIDERL